MGILLSNVWYMQHQFLSTRAIVWIFFVIVFIGVVYLLMTDETIAPDTDVTMNTSVQQNDTQLPEGVSIVERDGVRILRDERVGYEMETPNSFRISFEDTRLFYHDNSPVPAVILGINFFEKLPEDSLEDWLRKRHEAVYLLYYDEREVFELNNTYGYKIKTEGEVDHYVYYFINSDKVLSISTPYSERFENIIKGIAFFE